MSNVLVSVTIGIGEFIQSSKALARGVVFNLYLGMSVWDYSEVKGNILGQICPLYSMLWCFICIPIAAAESFFDGEKFAVKREVIP